MKIYDETCSDTQTKIDEIKKRNAEFAEILRPVLEEILKVAPEGMFGNSPTLKEATFLSDELPENVDGISPKARFLIQGREKGLLGYKEPKTTGEFNAWCFRKDGQYTFVLEQIPDVYSRNEIARIKMPYSKTDQTFQKTLRERLVKAVAKYSVLNKG